jgi:gas vesicle protein
MIWVVALAGILVGVFVTLLWMKTQLKEKRQVQHQKHQKALQQLEEDHRRRLQDATQSLKKEYDNRLAVATDELNQTHQEQIAAAIQASQHDANTRLQQTITDLKQSHAEELTSTIPSFKPGQTGEQAVQPEADSHASLEDEAPAMNSMFAAAAIATGLAIPTIEQPEEASVEMEFAPVADAWSDDDASDELVSEADEPAIAPMASEFDSLDINSTEDPAEVTYLLDPFANDAPADDLSADDLSADDLSADDLFTSDAPSLEDLFSSTLNSPESADLIEVPEAVANPFDLSDHAESPVADASEIAAYANPFDSSDLDIEAEIAEEVFELPEEIESPDLDSLFAGVSHVVEPEPVSSELVLDATEPADLFGDSPEEQPESMHSEIAQDVAPEASDILSFDDVDFSQELTLFSNPSDAESLLVEPAISDAPNDDLDFLSVESPASPEAELDWFAESVVTDAADEGFDALFVEPAVSNVDEAALDSLLAEPAISDVDEAALDSLLVEPAVTDADDAGLDLLFGESAVSDADDVELDSLFAESVASDADDAELISLFTDADMHSGEPADLDTILMSMSAADNPEAGSTFDNMLEIDEVTLESTNIVTEQNPSDLMTDAFEDLNLSWDEDSALDLNLSDTAIAAVEEPSDSDFSLSWDEDSALDLNLSDTAIAAVEEPLDLDFSLSWDEDSALESSLSEVAALDWETDEDIPAEPVASDDSTVYPGQSEPGEIDHTELTNQAALAAMILQEQSEEQPLDIIPTQVSNTIVSVPQLRQLADHADAQVRQDMAEQVLKMAEQRKLRAELKPVIPVLGRLTQDSMPQVRTQAVQALGQIQSFQVLPFLRRALRDTSPEVTQAAAIAIRQVKPVTRKAVKSAVKRAKR